MMEARHSAPDLMVHFISCGDRRKCRVVGVAVVAVVAVVAAVAVVAGA